MHYYSFNIGDYAKHARHLSNDEDLAYRRLLDLYYLEEKPLNANTEKLSKLIGMRDNQEDVEYVLETFFTMQEDGFHNKRADRDIDDYHSKADTARANGKKGGRPKKADSNPDETGLEPIETQSVILANPDETGSQANHKPLTNNQEPIKKTSRFTPPLEKEVLEYMQEKEFNYPSEASSFVSFYESKGWLVGKTKMKDWKASVRGWISRSDKKKTVTQTATPKQVTPHIDEDAMMLEMLKNGI